MNKIIVSNMKMNLNIEDINKYLDSLKNKNLENIIFCPTSIYLNTFIENGLNTGIQNISLHEVGAYTGEISAKQASSIGVKYAIVGHSELRKNFNETNDIINEKIKLCIKNEITPILCVGENKDEDPYKIIEKDLDECLKDIETNRLIVAYEPSWAVGSNMTPSLQELDTITLYIKNYLKQKYSSCDIIILYGGSINKKNISKFINLQNLDGILIGNASLNVIDFLDMIEVALS